MPGSGSWATSAVPIQDRNEGVEASKEPSYLEICLTGVSDGFPGGVYIRWGLR